MTTSSSGKRAGSGKARSEAILKRVLAESGIPGLKDALVRLSGRDLQTLLLRVYEDRAGKLSAADVARRYASNRFVRPSDVDGLELLELDGLFVNSVRGRYELVECSPVSPFAASSVLTAINQKTVLTTVRDADTAADTTVALALESAARRQAALDDGDPQRAIRLASSQRLTRAQQFHQPGFTPHFRIFALVTAGSRSPGARFEIESLIDHLTVYLTVLEAAQRAGRGVSEIVVSLSHIRIMEAVAQEYAIPRGELVANTQTADYDPFAAYSVDLPARVASPPTESAIPGVSRPLTFLAKLGSAARSSLSKRFPEVRFDYDLARVAGIGYFTDVCFNISARAQDGQVFPLVDGGFNDWTRQLLRRNDERLATSAFGSELFCRYFRSSSY
jgi:hypothetical protein